MKMAKKVILVESVDSEREIHKKVMGLIGYDVHAYKDGFSALRHIVQNGHAPFVLVGPFNMGDVYSADEVKRCLNVHSRRTGVDYGMVSFDVPDAARGVLEKERVPYVRREFDLTRISEKVDEEFRRLEKAQASKQAYEGLSEIGKMLLGAELMSSAV